MHSSDKLTPALHTEEMDPNHDSPGRQLRLARERAHLSLDQVAAELHLSTATLNALEDDHYDGLPSPVFISGYLKSYARLLRLDPDALLEGYRRQQPAATANPVLSIRGAQPVQSRSSVGLAVVSVAVVAALAAGIWFWWLNPQDSAPLETAADGAALEDQESIQPMSGQAPAQAPPVSGSAPSIALPVPTEAGSLPNSEPSPPDEAEEREQNTPPNRPASEDSLPLPLDAQPSSGLIAALGRDANAKVPATADDTEAPAASDRARPAVIMTFSGPCWVDVRDATGEFKLFGEMNKGDREVLGGQGPYSMILGNAAAVELTIDGEPFDVEAIARGNVARFDLDPAQP